MRIAFRYSGSQQVGLSNTASAPNAAALRKTPPTLSAFVTPSRTTSMRRANVSIPWSSAASGPLSGDPALASSDSSRVCSGQRRRPFDERETAAVDVVPGEAQEVGRLALVDRHAIADRREQRPETSNRRLVQEQRSQRVAAFLDEAADDQASLGDEQPVGFQEVGVGEVAIRRDAGIGRVEETLDGHVAERPRDTCPDETLPSSRG